MRPRIKRTSRNLHMTNWLRDRFQVVSQQMATGEVARTRGNEEGQQMICHSDQSSREEKMNLKIQTGTDETVRLSRSATNRLLLLMLFATLGLTADQIAMAQATPSGARDEIRVVPRQESGEVQPTTFLQMRNDSEGNPEALQTAITRFRPADGDVIVDLIGAVHIGDGDYYQRLNRQFELYDVVLYELVAPEGTRVPAGGGGSSGNPIGMLQQSAQRMLGLESQLAMVDYQKENFVHADLSPAQMQEKMAERGDSALTLGLSALSEMIRNQNRAMQEAKDNPDSAVNQLASGGLMEMMSNPKQMKLMMASQFADGGAMDAGLGQTLNQLVIDDRNEAAMRILQQQLALGKTKIAIFYGAAHMPDFETRLIRDFGLSKTDQVWVDAWDLTREVQSPAADPLNMMMQMLKSLDE